jgi:hypothetical protein
VFPKLFARRAKNGIYYRENLKHAPGNKRAGFISTGIRSSLAKRNMLAPGEISLKENPPGL